jgi:Mor family transcriptional regulator
MSLIADLTIAIQLHISDQTLTDKIVRSIQLSMGGQAVYIPKPSNKKLHAARNHQIITAIKNGKTLNELTGIFGLSNCQIRRISGKKPKSKWSGGDADND